MSEDFRTVLSQVKDIIQQHSKNVADRDNKIISELKTLSQVRGLTQQDYVSLVSRIQNLVQAHAEEVQRRDNLLIQALDALLRASQPATTTVSTTTSNQLIQVLGNLNVTMQQLLKVLQSSDIASLNANVQKLTTLLQDISTKGIPSRPFTKMIPQYLYGNVGLKKQGQTYKLPVPADFVYIIPSVEAHININSSDLGDQIPALYANGALAAEMKTEFIAYRASSAVPDSVLPAPLSIWAFYY